MIKVQHISNNHVFGAPVGWDQRQLPCDALPVTVTTVGGHACIQSFWRPSPEDLAALNNGGLVCVGVLGMSMPPIMVDVIQE